MAIEITEQEARQMARAQVFEMIEQGCHNSRNEYEGITLVEVAKAIKGGIGDDLPFLIEELSKD